MSIKGFCCNDQLPAHVTSLAPDWVAIEFGRWNWDYSAQYGAMKWALHVYDQTPNVEPLTAQNIALAKNHAAYEGWWLIGNEPYLNTEPEEFIAKAVAQMTLILSVDPAAKFCLAAGINFVSSSTHDWSPLWYVEDSWFDRMWTRFPSGALKQAVRAFGLHAYPDPLAVGLIEYLGKSNDYRNSRFPAREIWLTEIGRGLDRPETQYSPNNVNGRCNAKSISRWSWFSQSLPYPYFNLQDGNGALTPTGQEFAGV